MLPAVYNINTATGEMTPRHQRSFNGQDNLAKSVPERLHSGFYCS